MEFDIEDYECSNGRKYAREFLVDLETKNADLWAALVARIQKMKYRNYHKLPYSKAFGEGLFEVRATAKTDIARVFYCFGKGQMIYLLRGFVKKDQETPDEEIKKARKLLEEYSKRKGGKYAKN